MSYTIIARCARTGQLGLAVASYSIAVGLYSDAAVRSGVGATFTQGHPELRNNRLAIGLLGMGMQPRHALREIEGNDGAFEYRQIGMIDREGSIAAHTGAKVAMWAGHREGLNHLAMSEGAAGEAVLVAMSGAFESDPGQDLDERLLRALEAGRDAGGLVGKARRLPERSCLLVVWGTHDYSDMDLRVDFHETAVDDLRRIYHDYKPTATYYEERARNPRDAIPAKEFAAQLKARREREAS